VSIFANTKHPLELIMAIRYVIVL